MTTYIVTRKSDGAEVYRYNADAPIEWGGMEFATPDNHDPFGGAVVNVRWEKPGVAIGYSTTGGSGPTAADIAAAVWAYNLP